MLFRKKRFIPKKNEKVTPIPFAGWRPMDREKQEPGEEELIQERNRDLARQLKAMSS